MKIISLKRKKDEIEEQRAAERGRILYMKRFEKHIMVQDYLNQALKDNAVMEELVNLLPFFSFLYLNTLCYVVFLSCMLF